MALDPTDWRSSRMKPPDRHACSRCGTEKPFDGAHFKPMEGRRWGLDKICLACRRTQNADKRLKAVTGLSRTDYAAALAGGCWLCGAEAKRRDRDPVTGNSRGPVCLPCGNGLALLANDPDRLEKAAQVLRAHRRAWFVG